MVNQRIVNLPTELIPKWHSQIKEDYEWCQKENKGIQINKVIHLSKAVATAAGLNAADLMFYNTEDRMIFEKIATLKTAIERKQNAEDECMLVCMGFTFGDYVQLVDSFTQIA